MANLFELSDFTCLNQLINGAAFGSDLSNNTPNLVGNAGELVKLTYTVKFEILSSPEPFENWETKQIGGKQHFTRDVGDWNDDGLKVGDVIRWDDSYKQIDGFNTVALGVIEYISPDGKFMVFTSTFTVNATYSRSTTNCGFQFLPNADNTPFSGSNEFDFTGAFLRFGIIENGNDYDNVSLTTNEAQGFYFPFTAKAVATGGTQIGSYKGWLYETAAVEITPQSDGEFDVEHTLLINPVVLPGGVSDLENGVIPDLFSSESGLKYAFQIEVRPSTTDPRALRFTSDGETGATGWYDENFNGFENDFTVESVSYAESGGSPAVSAIQANDTTEFTIEVSATGAALANGDTVGVYLYRVPNDFTELQAKTTTLQKNYIYETAVCEVGAGAVTNGQLASVQALINGGGNIEVTGEITYTTAQQTKILEGDYYVLAVQVQRQGETAGNSTRVMLLADLNQYILNAVTGLVTYSSYGVLLHPDNLNTKVPVSAANQWPEDGIIVDGIFTIDRDRQSLIQTVMVEIVATDGTTEWSLDTYEFDVSQTQLKDNAQQINFEASRGYNLPENGAFDTVTLDFTGIALNQAGYQLRAAVKIPWQSWIANPETDPSFYDNSQPNNNLNLLTSNYSMVSGFEIKARTTLVVNGEDDLGRDGVETNVNDGVGLDIYEYDTADSADITSVELTLHDPDTDTDTDGVILRNKNTLMRARWTVLDNDPTNTYGIHRIETTGDTGRNIEEFSSVRSNINGLLKPLSGETALKVYADGADIVTECLIDHTQLNETELYNLSARLGQPTVIRWGYVSFAFREYGDGEVLVWYLPTDKVVRNAELVIQTYDGDLTTAPIKEADLTFEYSDDFGVSYTTAASFAALANWMESNSATGVENQLRVRVTCAANNYDFGLMGVRYQLISLPSPNVDFKIIQNNLNIDKEAIFQFDDFIELTDLENGDGNNDILYAVRTTAATAAIWTEFTEYTTLAALNADLAPTAIMPTYQGVYDGGTTYAAGEIVREVDGGEFYVSLVGGNTGNQPSTSPAFWEVYNFRYALHLYRNPTESGNAGEIVISGNYTDGEIQKAVLVHETAMAETPEYRTALNKNARIYDGTSDRDRVNSFNRPASTDAFTITTVFNLETYSESVVRIFEDRTDVAPDSGFDFTLRSDGRVNFGIVQSSVLGASLINSFTGVSAVTGRNIVTVRYDGSELLSGLTIYVNGIKCTSANGLLSGIDNLNTGFAAAVNNAFVGFYSAKSGSFFDGKIVEFSIVDYAQTDQEIYEQFLSGAISAGTGAYLLNMNFNKTGTTAPTDDGPAGYTITPQGSGASYGNFYS